jgi:hypothetical protein
VSADLGSNRPWYSRGDNGLSLPVKFASNCPQFSCTSMPNAQRRSSACAILTPSRSRTPRRASPGREQGSPRPNLRMPSWSKPGLKHPKPGTLLSTPAKAWSRCRAKTAHEVRMQQPAIRQQAIPPALPRSPAGAVRRFRCDAPGRPGSRSTRTLSTARKLAPEFIFIRSLREFRLQAEGMRDDGGRRRELLRSQ